MFLRSKTKKVEMWSQLLTEHLAVPNEAAVLKLKKRKRDLRERRRCRDEGF